MTAEEKKWRAESDAETLARYQELLDDAVRMRAAVAAARTKAADLNKRAAAMTRAASTKSKKK